MDATHRACELVMPVSATRKQAMNDDDAGERHPLPQSDEARHDEVPETLEREKGRGEEGADIVQPAARPVTPDGEQYGEKPRNPQS
jgi:hypothetical protein